MTAAGEYHREAVLVGRGDHFRVANGSARLNDRGCAGGRDRIQSVTERKERVRRRDRAGQRTRVLRVRPPS